MVDSHEYRVRIVLERIEVLDDLDPFWCNPGEVRFSSRVVPARDSTRAVTTRFPTSGVYRMHPAMQVIEGEIFDDVIFAGEDLTIEIAGIEEDVFTSDDEFPLYERRFTGDPPDWAGRYGPDGVEAPEPKGAWRLWLRIEVTPAAEVVARDPDWGPNFADELLRDQRRDRGGKFDPNLWNRALAHRGRMRPSHPLDDLPTEPRFEEETRACAVLNGEAIGVELVENPLQVRTPGATGRVVQVVGKAAFEDYADLAVGLMLEEIAGLDPGSIRLLRWDDRRRRFAGVPRSGMSPDGRYVWAKINKPGIYGAFGLPADPARRTTLELLRSVVTWDTALQSTDIGFSFIDPICLVILCADHLRDTTRSVARLQQLGLEYEIGIDPRTLGDLPLDEKGRPIGPRPRQGSPLGPGVPSLADLPPGRDWCEECLGLRDVPGGIIGLPEIELLDPHIFDPSWFYPRRPACAQWDSIGPTNLGGRVQALAWHPTDSSIVYAGNSQGGVYRSTNGGTTWRAMMSGELTLAIGGLAVAPSNPAIVYAGTGEYNGFRYQNGVGMYRSTDGGEDWDLTGGASFNLRYSRIVVHPTDPQVVFASGNAGVERSLDGGETWQLILTGGCSDIAMDPSAPDTLYAGMEDARGVQTTTDARAAAPTWTAMNSGLTQAQNHSTDPRQNYIKLAAGSAGGDTVLWLQINSLPDPWPGADPPIWTDYKLSVYRWDGSSWQLRRDRNDVSYWNWCSTIACEPANPQVVYVGGVGLEWSSDDGATWNSLGAGHADQHAVAFDPNDPNRTIVGNDGGLYRHTRTATETTWNYAAANTSHVTIQFLNVAVSQTGTLRVAGSTQDQGVLVNDHVGTDYDGLGGAEWGPVDIYARDGNIIVWDPHRDQGPVLQRSDDGGATRRDADNGLGGRWVNEVAIHPADSDILLVATPAQNGNPAAIYRSTDGAAPAPATGFIQAATFTSTVSDIAFAPGTPTRVYSAVGNTVWASDDTGATWQALVAGPSWASIASITVDWDDEDLVYITYRNAGIRHVHRGEVNLAAATISWTDISGRRDFSSLPDVPAHALVIDRYASERLYVATDIGVFRTLDGGDWWYPFDEGLPNALVNDIALRVTGHRLYVSTFGRGMYSREI